MELEFLSIIGQFLWGLIFANFVVCVKFINNLYGSHLILDQFVNILPRENYPIYSQCWQNLKSAGI